MAILEEISEFLQKGRAAVVKEKVQAALDEGISAKDILEKGLLHGMGIIGNKFKNNEVFVPEVLVAARAMNMGAAMLKPYLTQEGVTTQGTAVLGTVKGDLHDIGKNLVKMMLEGKGINVIDLGVDVATDKFIDAAVEHNAQLICCSALLTTTMGEMKNVVEAAEKAGIRDKVKIMVGGAPITQSFCDSIGADCYTSDAASAAEEALRLISELK
ncbi:MAG: cobalamin-binding protein [Clostridiales bacterium]|nr:cobalamin-binding protein [Clostridiales bacterium]